MIMQCKCAVISILDLVLGICCGQTEKTRIHNGERRSLGGNWKVHAVVGEGSNDPDISETSEDIVMDKAGALKANIKRGWKLGLGDLGYVELTATTSGSLAAGAVMFRPVSEEKIELAGNRQGGFAPLEFV